jgi:hypothetical protein
MKTTKKYTLLGITLILSLLDISISNAQWSYDPTENLEVRDTAGWLVVPHVAACPSGESYISWYSATEGLRFDVYLQRFDMNGNKLWDENGLLISDNPTETWVSDYSLALDQEDCAILITQDQRDGHSNAFAYRISEDGTFLWGPDGIRITNTADGNYWPQVLVTNESDIIFLYPNYPADTMQISSLGIQKRDSEGNLQWGDITIQNDSLNYFTPQFLLTEDDNLIVSWLTCLNPSNIVPGQERWVHIQMQMFDTDGQLLWPEPVQPDTGNYMYYAGGNYIPFLEKDGEGGAYIIWQSYNEEGHPTARVNHVSASGQLLWPENGKMVAEHPGYQQYDPIPCYHSGSNNLFVFWTEYHHDDNSDCWGIAGQKFSTDGMRLWGNSGNLFVPMMCAVDSAWFLQDVESGGSDGLCLFFQKEYLEIEGADTLIKGDVYASLIDVDGNFAWAEGKVPITTATSTKVHFDAGNYSQGQWIGAWDDNRQNPQEDWNTGIYAQNITVNGNLGPLGIKNDLTANNTVLGVYPNPFVNKFEVEFELEHKQEVIFQVTDSQGRIVWTLNAGQFICGKHTLVCNLMDLSPGMYILKIKAGMKTGYSKILKGNAGL